MKFSPLSQKLWFLLQRRFFQHLHWINRRILDLSLSKVWVTSLGDNLWTFFIYYTTIILQSSIDYYTLSFSSWQLYLIILFTSGERRCEDNGGLCFVRIDKSSSPGVMGEINCNEKETGCFQISEIIGKHKVCSNNRINKITINKIK